MFGQIRKMILGAVASTMLLAANFEPANAIGFNIDWTGTGGYTMTGMFSYDDSLIGTGPINGTDVNTFMIEGFLNGSNVGTWDFFADGLSAGATFNFNFNATSELFLIGGGSGGPTGQLWNSDCAGHTKFGFLSGTNTQAICVGSFEVGASSVSLSTLTASQKQVSEPATLAIFGLGLAGLGYMRRRQTA